MAYITIQDLDINKDYTAREIDLMTFKSILAKIQTFNNTLNQNLNYLKTNTDGKFLVSSTPPAYPVTDMLWVDTTPVEGEGE